MRFDWRLSVSHSRSKVTRNTWTKACARSGRRSLGEQQDMLIAGRRQFLVDKETERDYFLNKNSDRSRVLTAAKKKREGIVWGRGPKEKQERRTMNHACLKCIFKSVGNGWWASQTSGSERRGPAERRPSQPTSVTLLRILSVSCRNTGNSPSTQLLTPAGRRQWVCAPVSLA